MIRFSKNTLKEILSEIGMNEINDERISSIYDNYIYTKNSIEECSKIINGELPPELILRHRLWE